jgi:glycosyltransferase involved in cell wall biosynthesis
MSEQNLLTVAAYSYRQVLHAWQRDGWQPDIIHAQSVEDAGMIGMRLSKEMGIPLIITEHNPVRLNLTTHFKRKTILEAFKRASVVISVSNHQLRCLYLQGIERHMLVVGNLIDETMFSLQPKSQHDYFRILSVTYPSPIKDCDTLFRAIAELVQRGHADIRVTVIGHNSFRDLSRANVNEYVRMAREFGVESYCRFVPHVTRSEMQYYYSECDVYVSTSIAETFGIAVREAMMCGRPVVATASGGVDDCLVPENGQKVDVGDYKAVAEALIRVKNNSVNYVPDTIRNSVIRQSGRAAFLKQMRHAYQLACEGSPND